MKYVIRGQVVTMDAAFTVLDTGAIYVDGNTISAVLDAAVPAPAGFEGATAIDSGGVVMPGLIELHNHLSYDALPLWNVPKKFTNRNQWQNNLEYAKMVNVPMGIIANSKDTKLLASLAKFVDTKCLLGGVTTSQGISLKMDAMESYYHGALRLVDDPNDKAFPTAFTHIPDLVAADWTKFNHRLSTASCLLLHLSEGLDVEARQAFLALHNDATDQWAITSALAGIHCAGLNAGDFAVMGAHGGSTIWSPLSNLMLYGGTTDIAAARQAGVKVALGSDWSPSGSKNLLNELKIAKVVNDVNGIGMSDAEILAMTTIVPARIVKWDAQVGSLEVGKRADFSILSSVGGDAYASVFAATESSVHLVVIDGRPVVGTPAMMTALGAGGETLAIGGDARLIDYGPSDPKLPPVTYAESVDALTKALAGLPDLLASEAKGKSLATHSLIDVHAKTWSLALDEQIDTGFALRPKLLHDGAPTGPDSGPNPSKASLKPNQIIPLILDKVAVVDDPDGYRDAIMGQANIPDAVKEGLKTFYP